MERLIAKFLLGSWKTTALGFVGAIYILVKPSLDAGQWPTKVQWAGAVFSTLAGYVAKDYNRSGGRKSDLPIILIS